MLITIAILIKYFLIMYSVSTPLILLPIKKSIIDIIQLSFLTLTLFCAYTFIYSLQILDMLLKESDKL